ncbi:MAG: hypothetical protein QNK92_09825 [Amylibacter sp.]
MGIIIEFWYGRLGFVWSVLALIGVSAALSYGAVWIGWPVIVVLVVVSIWQRVGAVRFSERVLKEGALNRVYGAYAAMGVALVSNFLVGVGLVLPAPLVDLVVKGYAQKVSVFGDVVTVSGDIDYQILTELKATQNVRLVVLQSAGGSVQAGRAIGLFVSANGIDTRVDGQCFSACTLVFVGGVQRALGPQGSWGFTGIGWMNRCVCRR